MMDNTDWTSQKGAAKGKVKQEDLEKTVCTAKPHNCYACKAKIPVNTYCVVVSGKKYYCKKCKNRIKKPSESIEEAVNKAAELGISYGQYVARKDT